MQGLCGRDGTPLAVGGTTREAPPRRTPALEPRCSSSSPTSFLWIGAACNEDRLNEIHSPPAAVITSPGDSATASEGERVELR